jgi:hypothetical protein
LLGASWEADVEPCCPACTSTRVRYNAVLADCAACGHSWPVEILQLELEVDDRPALIRLPAPSPRLRELRDASARTLVAATGSARRAGAA